MKCRYVESYLRVFFLHHGKLVARHPVPFLIVPILVTAALASGVIPFFTIEEDPETLSGPQGSQSRHNRVILDELYSDVKDENMLPRHKLWVGQWGLLIVTPKDNSSILTTPNMAEVLRLHETVHDISIQVDDGTYTFANMCLSWNGRCQENDVLSFIEYDENNLGRNVLTYPVARKSNGDYFPTAGFIGGVTLGDAGVIERAEALLLIYNLRFDTDEETQNGLKWERKFLAEMEQFVSDQIDVYGIVSISFSDELNASSAITFGLIAIVSVLVGSYCVLSTSMMDWVRSKPILVMLGLCSAGLALGSTFGTMAYVGIPYCNSAGSMPFLILGIGVDDMFIMISAWRQTSVHKSVPERMSKAMEESALSITITSITDAFAFGIGYFTNILSIRLFCIYACVAVVFCYFYMITFFAACVVFTGYREEQNRHAVTFRKVLPKKDAPSKAYYLFCAGGSLAMPSGEECQEDVDAKEESSSDSAVMIFFKTYYGPFMTHPVSAAFVILLFLGYLGVAIWGCVYLQESGELKQNIAWDDSYLRMYYKEEEKYFRSYGPDMSIVALSELEYWNPDVQNEIESVMEKLEDSQYFHNSNFSISWLRHYLNFLEDRFEMKEPSKELFISILQGQFLVLPVFQQFAPDVVFDSNNQSIISSRFYVLGKDLNKSYRERDMFWFIRNVLSKSKLDLVAYHSTAPWFYEQFIAIRSITVFAFGAGVASMFVISLILIPHPLCAIIVTISVISTIIGILGYMSHLHIPLDSISLVTLIISMGFSVDFSAHISYAYIAASFPDRRSKSIHALYSLGPPTGQGALSTILAIIMLAFEDSYLYRTFFWTMFLVIIVGLFHGLVFLPVFLMFLVPRKAPSEIQASKSPTKSKAETNIDSPRSIDSMDGPFALTPFSISAGVGHQEGSFESGSSSGYASSSRIINVRYNPNHNPTTNRSSNVVSYTAPWNAEEQG